MSLYENLGANQNSPKTLPILSQLRSHPAEVLKQAGMTIPDSMTDPQAIINHLLQTGQIPQSRYFNAIKMLSGRR